jgi:hypothetical protein
LAVIGLITAQRRELLGEPDRWGTGASQLRDALLSVH